jgi:F420 biosynthesis protein FbiB-like protein
MDASEILVFLRSRRSVRRFAAEPVSLDLIERIIETAGYAPSAHNRQPWRYVVLTSAQPKARLAAAMGEEFRHDLRADGVSEADAETQVTRSRMRIESAPVVICLFADFGSADPYPDAERQAADSLMLVQDTALSAMQLMLAAHAEGLGTVWMCAPLFAPETVRSTLATPETWEPQALILLGHPEKTPAPRQRKATGEIVRFL